MRNRAVFQNTGVGCHFVIVLLRLSRMLQPLTCYTAALAYHDTDDLHSKCDTCMPAEGSRCMIPRGSSRLRRSDCTSLDCSHDRQWLHSMLAGRRTRIWLHERLDPSISNVIARAKKRLHQDSTLFNNRVGVSTTSDAATPVPFCACCHILPARQSSKGKGDKADAPQHTVAQIISQSWRHRKELARHVGAVRQLLGTSITARAPLESHRVRATMRRLPTLH
jgi:hypothetical protein